MTQAEGPAYLSFLLANEEEAICHGEAILKYVLWPDGLPFLASDGNSKSYFSSEPSIIRLASQKVFAPVSEIALRLNQQSRAKHKSKLRRTNLTPNTRDSILFFGHSLEWDSQFDLFSYQFDWASSLILYHYFSYWNSKLRSLGSLFTSGLPCPPEGREVTRSQRKKIPSA